MYTNTAALGNQCRAEKSKETRNKANFNPELRPELANRPQFFVNFLGVIFWYRSKGGASLPCPDAAQCKGISPCGLRHCWFQWPHFGSSHVRRAHPHRCGKWVGTGKADLPGGVGGPKAPGHASRCAPGKRPLGPGVRSRPTRQSLVGAVAVARGWDGPKLRQQSKIRGVGKDFVCGACQRRRGRDAEAQHL